MWFKSFSGVCPTISSICNMFCFMWTVVDACDIGITRSHSSISILSLACVFDCSMPLLLLLVLWDSPSVLRIFRISASYLCSLSLWCVAWLKSFTKQSWTIMAIIYPSSSMIVRSGDAHCFFDFLRMPPICVDGLLFPLVPVCRDLLLSIAWA